MGDYQKLIVSCRLKRQCRDELEKQIDLIPFQESAYHSSESIVNVIEDERGLDLIVVGQTKFGRGQNEFCEWLRPHVMQGSGKNDIFAIAITEYTDVPIRWQLTNDDY